MTPSVPSVSIGVPVFNGLPFLAEALESLVNQTYQDLEFIICDNASDDGTVEVCQRFERRDQRVRVLRHDRNVGAAANYNRVFAEARGQYFKWAAADDVCLPTLVSRCVEVLQQRPEVVLCYPRTRIIDQASQPVGDYSDRMHLDLASPVRRFGRVIRNLEKCNCVFGLIRREVLSQTRLIGSYASSDDVLVGELALRGRFFEIQEQLFLRRDHPGQSIRAYPTMLARAAWFDPDLAVRTSYPMWRVLREYARAVSQAPLSPLSRAACYAQLASWPPHKVKGLLLDLARTHGSVPGRRGNAGTGEQRGSP